MILNPVAVAYPKTFAAAATMPKYASLEKSYFLPLLIVLTVAWFFFAVIFSTLLARTGGELLPTIGEFFPVSLVVFAILGPLFALVVFAAYPMTRLPLGLATSLEWRCSVTTPNLSELGLKRFGVSYPYAALATYMLELRERAARAVITDSNPAVEARLTLIVKDTQAGIERLFCGLEGVDGQTESDLGRRYLESSLTKVKALSERLDQMEKWRTDYTVALHFETPEGQADALALIAQDVARTSC